MSRVAKIPIELPQGVEITISDQEISVKGSKGKLISDLNNEVQAKKEGDTLIFSPRSNSKFSKAITGTSRAIVANMVRGVTDGFHKKLTLVGVGYRAQAQGDKLNLNLGFSHPVIFNIPDGVKVETPSQTEVVVSGMDKQKVGQVAAEIRRYRPPEPYKGKGVRYSDERVIIKEAKKK